MTQQEERIVGQREDEYLKRYGFKDDIKYAFKAEKGLSEDIVREISKQKKEPEWMLEKRLTAYRMFVSKPLPMWGIDLSKIDFNDIYYYIKPGGKKSDSWENVPEDIKRTFDKLGIPEAERKFFAGAEAQFDSEVVYSHVKAELEKDGVIFIDTDTAVKKYPELMKKYFGTLIPPTDNKFAALNTAVWSGGCLTEDCMIFTVNPGLKSIKDIEQGDTIFALSNDNTIVPAKVSAKIYSGRKPVYEFRAAGRTIRATRNHKFLTLNKSKARLSDNGKRWQMLWKSLGELKENDVIAVSKKLPDYGKPYKLPKLEHYDNRHKHLEIITTPTETNEDLAWFFGILIGDGNIYFPNENMCFINIALPLTDPCRDEALRVIKTVFNCNVKTQNNVSFTIHSKALGNWLKRIGISGKAKTKIIPNWVFGLPREQRLAFLGGLLDSDGYVDKNAGAVVRLELANKKLIEQIKLLAVSCGLFTDSKILERERTAIFKKESRKIYSGTSYSCRITGSVNQIGFRSNKIRKKLMHEKHTVDKYTTITGENFSCETNEWVGFAPIKDLKPVGEADVFDIQVDGYANFVANGVIAHNSFIYVPKGVKVAMPLQAYFRINADKAGQFERTLIVAEEGADVTYLEGCTAPIYIGSSLHAANVEIVAHKDAHVRYVTIQNWSKNVYNLVTQRAFAYENAYIEWIDANIGSQGNMKYPSVYLKGRGSKGEILSIAVAGNGQIQDTGGKVLHLAEDTSSKIISKSVSIGSGTTTFRGLVYVGDNSSGAKSAVRCDALLLDKESKTNTYPKMQIFRDDADITHEATVGKIGEDQVFYLMSRGLSEEEAITTIVLGFIQDLTKILPMEYSIELKRLIKLDMSKSVG